MTVKIIKIYGSHPPTNLGTGRLNYTINRNEIVSHTSTSIKKRNTLPKL